MHLFNFFLQFGQHLLEGGAYLKISYHKDKTFWLYIAISFTSWMSIFSWLNDLKLTLL